VRDIPGCRTVLVQTVSRSSSEQRTAQRVTKWAPSRRSTSSSTALNATGNRARTAGCGRAGIRWTRAAGIAVVGVRYSHELRRPRAGCGRRWQVEFNEDRRAASCRLRRAFDAVICVAKAGSAPGRRPESELARHRTEWHRLGDGVSRPRPRDPARKATIVGAESLTCFTRKSKHDTSLGDTSGGERAGAGKLR